jgi:hypothetical protein
VLFHEIIRFAITGKVNGVTLLLQVMAKMQTPGSVPQSLSADNKQDLHGGLCSKHMSLINDELLPGCSGFPRRRNSIILTWFRDDNPCNDIDNNTRSQREDCHYGPYEADDSGINIQMFTQTGTDSAQYPLFFRAIEMLHIKNFVLCQ